MARVLKGSHSFTCTPRVHPLTEWTIPAFAFPAKAGTHLPTPEGWKAFLLHIYIFVLVIVFTAFWQWINKRLCYVMPTLLRIHVSLSTRPDSSKTLALYEWCTYFLTSYLQCSKVRVTDNIYQKCTFPAYAYNSVVCHRRSSSFSNKIVNCAENPVYLVPCCEIITSQLVVRVWKSLLQDCFLI